MSDEELIKETMMLYYSQLVMHNVYMIKENKRLHSIIKEVREYIESIDKVEARYFDYNKALKQMLISYEDLKKKVLEDGTLEGHFIEINKLKLLEILEKENI